MSSNFNDFNNQPLPIKRTTGYANPLPSTPFESVGDECWNANTGAGFKASGKIGNEFVWTPVVGATGTPDSVLAYNSSGVSTYVPITSGSVLGNTGQGVSGIALQAGSNISITPGTNSLTIGANVSGSSGLWSPYQYVESTLASNVVITAPYVASPALSACTIIQTITETPQISGSTLKIYATAAFYVSPITLVGGVQLSLYSSLNPSVPIQTQSCDLGALLSGSSATVLNVSLLGTLTGATAGTPITFTLAATLSQATNASTTTVTAIGLSDAALSTSACAMLFQEVPLNTQNVAGVTAYIANLNPTVSTVLASQTALPTFGNTNSLGIFVFNKQFSNSSLLVEVVMPFKGLTTMSSGAMFAYYSSSASASPAISPGTYLQVPSGTGYTQVTQAFVVPASAAGSGSFTLSLGASRSLSASPNFQAQTGYIVITEVLAQSSGGYLQVSPKNTLSSSSISNFLTYPNWQPAQGTGTVLGTLTQSASSSLSKINFYGYATCALNGSNVDLLLCFYYGGVLIESLAIMAATVPGTTLPQATAPFFISLPSPGINQTATVTVEGHSINSAITQNVTLFSTGEEYLSGILPGTSTGFVQSWTPIITFSSGGATYAAQAGSIYYGQSFGNLWQVYVTALVTITPSGASGNVLVTGLPLALTAIGSALNCTPLGNATNISAPASILGSLQVGYTTSASAPTPLQIVYFTSAGVQTALAAGNIGASATIQFSFTALTTTAP